MAIKRLLVLNYEFPPLGGGASPVSYELAKRLSETGEFDIDVVTMRYKGLSEYEEVNSHMRIHRVTCLRSKKEMCYPWEQLTYLVTAYFKCRQLIKKQPYDICHTHFIIPTGILALKLKKKFGLEYIVTSHGSDVLGYNKRFEKLYPYLLKPWKAVLDNAKTVTTPSQYLKNQILEQYSSFRESKIVVIPNGIDALKFKPQLKKNYIFSAGRLQKAKGFQYLINAVSGNDLGWEVHIAGDGPMRGELEEMAKKSKTKIIFHGWLNNNGEEYKNLIEKASIFVSVSEYESFGLAIVEAMSSGCAVITGNNSGSSEVIQNAGIAIQHSSIEEIKLNLLKLIKSPDYLLITQNKCKLRSNDFNWNNILNIFKNVI